MNDDKRIKRLVHGRPHRLVLRFARGFGDLCLAEIEALARDPIEPTKLTPTVTAEANGIRVDGVSYRGALEIAWRTLTAREVLLEVERAPKVTNKVALDKFLAEAPLTFHLPPGGKVAVRARSTASRLYHEGLIREHIESSLTAGGYAVAKAADADALVDARMDKDELVLSVALPGVEAFRRGYKPELTADASVREDLAAAACRALGDFAPTMILNPFAGSGTLGAEALLRALGAPGAMFREDWAALFAPACPQKTLQHLLGKLAQRASAAPKLLFVESSSEAATKLETFAESFAARLTSKGYPRPEIVVAREDFFAMDLAARLHGERTLIALNPPYGVRLGTRKGAQKIYRRLAEKLKDIRSLEAVVAGFVFGFEDDLAPVAEALAKRAKVDASRTFMHGGLELTLLVFS